MTPRDEDKAREKLLADCRRPAFARLARYTKPMDDGTGETITRASVKFVEAALARWGNVSTQTVITADTDKARTVRVLLKDEESGNTYSKEIQLEKTAERTNLAPRDTQLGRRQTVAGSVYIVRATEDDLAAHEAVLASNAVRQLGLRILPADLVAECMDAVAKTVGDQPHGVTALIPSAEDAAVHPQESRSSALAGLLRQRRGVSPSRPSAARQNGSKAQQCTPCKFCGQDIENSGDKWLHRDGTRRCPDRFHCATPGVTA